MRGGVAGVCRRVASHRLVEGAVAGEELEAPRRAQHEGLRVSGAILQERHEVHVPGLEQRGVLGRQEPEELDIDCGRSWRHHLLGRAKDAPVVGLGPSVRVGLQLEGVDASHGLVPFESPRLEKVRGVALRSAQRGRGGTGVRTGQRGCVRRGGVEGAGGGGEGGARAP